MAANLFCTTANSNENAKENGAFTVSKMINQNTPNNDKYNIGKRVDGKEPGKVTRVYLQWQVPERKTTGKWGSLHRIRRSCLKKNQMKNRRQRIKI
jgi:hypothetical protein